MSVKPNVKPVTVNTIKKLKRENTPITSLTAYDYSTAKYIDEAGIDIILVGDSLAMVALGHPTTHAVTMDEMIHHTKAVTRAAERSLVVADMPFMSYQVDLPTAIQNAGRFIKEANAGAIKLEGATDRTVEVVRCCVETGIPVLAHIGFTPQFIHTIGGYLIQGKTMETAKKLLEQALKLQEAGAFAIVLEMVPEDVAKYITENLEIPTLSVGAGRYCSGQMLVSDDILGKYSNFTPKFAKKYANLSEIITEAVKEYRNDVLAKAFPTEEHIFELKDDEKERLKNA